MVARRQALRLLVAAGVSIICIILLGPWNNRSLPTLERLSDVKNSIGRLAHLQTSTGKGAVQPDPLLEQPPYGAIIAAGRSTEDLTWMTFFKQNWTTYVYDVDNPQNPDPRLQFPAMKGHEAMVNLTWIIDNYETIPWCAIFIHGHQEAWHQEDTIARLLNDLRLDALARVGFINLRCDWYPSCPAEIRPKTHDTVVWGPGVYRKEAELAIAGNWKQLFPGVPLPDTLASQCCAQFSVTRQTIMKRPKSDYERLRTWLLRTLLDDQVSGRVLEKLWAYLFTGEAVHCPPPQECACQYFGRCGPQRWALPPEGLPLPSGWR